MLRSLTTAATGMIAQQNYLDVISNNVANVNTTGFKKETILNVAKLHGWKIGIDYVEPTLFDDDF